MSGDGDSRKRLRPWLEAKINGGTIPGLEWVDAEKTMFTIPWKHAGKQDWTPDQSVLFMEWAKHTGRYREGVDDLDYATWKTRLRCAFNKAPDIQEVKEMTNLDAINPFRVYKLLPKKQTKRLPMETPPQIPKTEYKPTEELLQQWNRNAPASDASSTVGATAGSGGGEQAMSLSGSIPSDLKSLKSDDILMPSDGTAQLDRIKQEMVDGVQSMECADSIGGPATVVSSSCSTVVDNTPKFVDLSCLHDSLPDTPNITALLNSSSGANYSEASVSESTHWFAQQSPESVVQTQAAPQQQQHPAPAVEALQPIPTTEYQQHHHLAPAQPHMAGAVYQSTGTDGDQIELGSIPDKLLEAAYPGSSLADQLQAFDFSENQMRVVLRYTTNVVYDQNINGSTGCRIFHGCNNEPLGPPEMVQIKLPAASEGLVSRGHEVPTTQLLQNLDKGLLLQCRDGDMYANRLCNCRVFYSTYNTGSNCVGIPRGEATKIFDLNAYKAAIQAHRDGNSTSPCPTAQVYLWFGQQVQPSLNLTSKVLISAAVFSVDAKMLEMDAERFTSMLISKSDDSERLAAMLKGLSEKV